MLLGNAM